MNTKTRLPNSWEAYTAESTFLFCEFCAREYAKEYGIELERGLHTYGETVNGCGVMECYACGHDFDYPPTCDGCGAYLAGNLTPDGVEYLKERNFPKWLRDYYLSTN